MGKVRLGETTKCTIFYKLHGQEGLKTTVTTGRLFCLGRSRRFWLLVDYENEETEPVRVRAPLPKKEKIIENAERWIEKDDKWQSVEQWVEFYINCREKEIYDQIHEIRKSVKRLKQYALGVAVAKEALREYKENKT